MKFFSHVLISALVLRRVAGFAPGLKVSPAQGGDPITVQNYIMNGSGRTLFIFGTYAADFNNIEYAQRLRYYLPQLRAECGVTKIGMVMNCQPDAALAVTDMVDLDTSQADIFVDNKGEVARQWGVNRGFLPDYQKSNPYLKLFAMLWGLGAWATLPAVIGGYIGNPFNGQPWIEDALAVGQRKGRWPDTSLDIDANGKVSNKFAELPLVGSWPRRPLELATLRLQSMVGISLKNWKDLSPDDEALGAGVLTQLGGCMVVDSKTGETIYEWKDNGICSVCNFEEMIKVLKGTA